MASLITHVVAPLIVLGHTPFARPTKRALRPAVAAVAVAADLDHLGFVWELRNTDIEGHRGAGHSFFVAVVIAVLVWGILCIRVGRRDVRALGMLMFAACLHSALDWFTQDEAGVALLWPVHAARLRAPAYLFASCPGGPANFLGVWGALTLANEILFLWAPLLLGFRLWRVSRMVGDARRDLRRGALRSTALWFACALGARLGMPDWFTPTRPRALAPMKGDEAGEISAIPREQLPEQQLLTRWRDLEAAGLFGVELRPSRQPWSSSFFPSWFGGEAGRWSEGNAVLVWRTLVGFAPPSHAEAETWLRASRDGDARARDRVFSLAPLEKLDLALSRLDFPATRAGLALSHNGRPKLWNGRCNGVATAALHEPEPFRTVRARNRLGQVVRFHPNDVKALLAVAYHEPVSSFTIGADCNEEAFDGAAACSMNPGTFILAALNQVGRGRETFLVDALPNTARQYYALAAVRVDALGASRPYDGARLDEALVGHIRELRDVAVHIVLSSTTVPYRKVSTPEPADPTRYARVGLVPVTLDYRATLALGVEGEVLGGTWVGNPAAGPDVLVEVTGGPKLTPSGDLAAAPNVPWRLVRALADASVAQGDEQEVDVEGVMQGR